jgi:hypothetical protein
MYKITFIYFLSLYVLSQNHNLYSSFLMHFVI